MSHYYFWIFSLFSYISMSSSWVFHFAHLFKELSFKFTISYYLFNFIFFWNFYFYSITVVCLFSPFIIAKYWKQPKCPSANEWIKKLWYIYTMEFYAAERKKELTPFATAWMELESIMLSEISQAVKDKYHMISCLILSYLVFLLFNSFAQLLFLVF